MTGAVGLWLPVVLVLVSWAGALGAVFVLAQWVSAHERAHFWCRRWAQAALPALIAGCAVVLLTGYLFLAFFTFALIWMISEESTRPIAASVDRLPKQPRFPPKWTHVVTTLATGE